MNNQHTHSTPQNELPAWLAVSTTQPGDEAETYASPLSVLARQRQYTAAHEDGAALAPLQWLARHRRWMRRA